VNLNLSVLEGSYAVCRLEAGSSVPAWAWGPGKFVSVSRTSEELSVVCASSLVPDSVRAEREWSCLKLEGPFEFTLTGILNSVLEPLRNAGIGIFAVSTFDTDYVLLKTNQLEAGIAALEAKGHRVQR
jgi:hypothetical protein